MNTSPIPSHGGKRARTIFTTEQLERMEREFHKQQYVGKSNLWLKISPILYQLKYQLVRHSNLLA